MAGFDGVDLMRGIGVAAALTAMVLLVLVEFVFRARLHRATYHWLLLLGLFFLAGTSLTSAGVSLLEETKTVSSCNSCHVMQPYVDAMQDPESETLAAIHFRNRWIAHDQCYACHTTYGFQGTVTAKLSGMQHWWHFAMRTWPDPIQYRGTYPNANCLACHEGTPKYEGEEMHQLAADELHSDEGACIDCHVAPHPRDAEEAKG